MEIMLRQSIYQSPTIYNRENEDEDDFDLVDVGDETSESQMRLTRTAKAHLNSFMAFMNRKDSSMYVHVAYTSTIPAEFFSKEYIGKFADYMMKTKKIQHCLTLLDFLCFHHIIRRFSNIFL